MGRPLIDITGQKIGHLLVLSILPKRDKYGAVFCNCRCDCGQEKAIKKSSLVKEHPIKSCGCKQHANPGNKNPNREDALWRQIYLDRILKRGRQKNIKVDLSFGAFIEISLQPCHYCGVQRTHILKDFDNKRKVLVSNTKIFYNGLDRINPSKGYHPDNIVSCCQDCNYAKAKMSQRQFKDFIARVYHHYCVK